MADKAITDLTQALQITNEDLFVLEQSGEAKKLKGATLLDFVTLSVVSVTVTTLPAGSSATATYDKSTGTLALGIPQGNKGETGQQGPAGPANVLTIGSVTSGKVASATITGEAPNQVLNLVLEKGDKGETGATGATGDTGPQGEQGIQGPQGSPGADAPTITNITIRQSDYHLIVTLSDGTSYDAGYCRGASGAGTGDMLASVYDPNNKHQDIFAYVDNAIKDVKVTTDATPTQGSTNPVQSGGVYSALANKLDKTGDGSNVTAAFTAASTRANIATGEKLSVLFGKIAKWFADFGSLAFKNKVSKSDLTSDVQTSLGKADSALQSAPVTSVNGQIGDVEISADNVLIVTANTNTNPMTVNTPFADIKAAVQAGKVVLLAIGAQMYYCAATPTSNMDSSITFFQCRAGNDSATIIADKVNSDGTITINLRTLAYYNSLTGGGLVKAASNGYGLMQSAVAEEDYASPVIMRKVTLTASGWNSSTKQQSVTVSGILADTTKQCIYPAPVDTSYDSAWNSCGVLCVAQAANSLTFQCSEVPTSAIDVYVTVITLSYKG